MPVEEEEEEEEEEDDDDDDVDVRELVKLYIEETLTKLYVEYFDRENWVEMSNNTNRQPHEVNNGNNDDDDDLLNDLVLSLNLMMKLPQYGKSEGGKGEKGHDDS